jgi:hypothetical protein
MIALSNEIRKYRIASKTLTPLPSLTLKGGREGESSIESHPSDFFAREHDQNDHFHNLALLIDKRHFSDHLYIKGQGKRNPVHPNSTEKKRTVSRNGG